jgi:excisionase family DNA binding protein
MPRDVNAIDSSAIDTDHDVLATPAEVAKMLRVPATWVYAHQNELPGLLRLGRYVRFRRTSIEQFLLSK